jgi:hypothetical protein
MEGKAVGVALGGSEGETEGIKLGSEVGTALEVGPLLVGLADTVFVGVMLGLKEGGNDSVALKSCVGSGTATEEGASDGIVLSVGSIVGTMEGDCEKNMEGDCEETTLGDAEATMSSVGVVVGAIVTLLSVLFCCCSELGF